MNFGIKYKIWLYFARLISRVFLYVLAVLCLWYIVSCFWELFWDFSWGHSPHLESILRASLNYLTISLSLSTNHEVDHSRSQISFLRHWMVSIMYFRKIKRRLFRFFMLFFLIVSVNFTVPGLFWNDKVSHHFGFITTAIK